MPRPDTWTNDKRVSGERPQEAAPLTTPHPQGLHRFKDSLSSTPGSAG